MTITMHLHAEPFQKIKNGKKKIEMRIKDEKRSKIKVGDIIEFENRKTKEIISKKVINIYNYKNFEELIKNYNKEILGYNEEDNILEELEIYYPKEEQEKLGVIAIELE